jgi:hypothetical protein
LCFGWDLGPVGDWVVVGDRQSSVERANSVAEWPFDADADADANGTPIGVALDGANRNDIKLLEPMLDSIITNGLTGDIELLALDAATTTGLCGSVSSAMT